MSRHDRLRQITADRATQLGEPDVDDAHWLEAMTTLTGLYQLADGLLGAVYAQRVECIWSGLIVIPAAGAWASPTLSAKFRSLHIANLSGDPLVIHADTPKAAPPNQGPGVWAVPAGAGATINSRTNVFTIYGSPGDTANLQIFAGHLAPTYSGLGGTATAGSAVIDGGTP